MTKVLSAQNTSIDSLQLLISQAGIDDTTRIGYMNSLSNKLWQKDIKQSNLLAREALEKSKKINYKKGMADALYNIGTIGFLQGRFMEAHQWLDYSIQIYGSISDKKGMASAIRNKAAVYSSQNNDTLALEYCFNALSIFKELDDIEGEVQIYNNLGILYDKQLLFNKALEYYYLTLKAMDSLEKGKIKGRAFVLNNIGINLNHQKQHEKAVTVLTSALKEARKDGNKHIESAILSNLGLAYYNIGKITRSLEYNIESIRLKEEMNDLQGLANALGNIGNVYRDLGLYHQAFESYEKSMKYARDLGLKQIILSNQREMAKAYSKAGDYERAYKLQEMALMGQDSLMQDEAKKRLGELQAQYEFEKKDQEISMLTYMKQKQEEKLTGNRFILYQVLILMIVLLVFISFMYKSYKEKVKVNIRLKELNSNLEALVLEEVNKNRQKDLMLIQKDRQIAMGEMISSIAHQWRQPLNALGILMQNIETAYFSKELTDAYMQKKAEK
ncbi:MAG: tetratricopeptide repeat protein, partial [Bacteroidales bacterium]|nr:tetratricopeptide repeat protein [Bacteroidales bacterium]